MCVFFALFVRYSTFWAATLHIPTFRAYLFPYKSIKFNCAIRRLFGLSALALLCALLRSFRRNIPMGRNVFVWTLLKATKRLKISSLQFWEFFECLRISVCRSAAFSKIWRLTISCFLSFNYRTNFWMNSKYLALLLTSENGISCFTSVKAGAEFSVSRKNKNLAWKIKQKSGHSSE